ncbi:GNAT family N-acetyltransferase, partial [Rathayibacter rathayi]|uniref:GNAT family N-acetyltransferase n=1 Tax=Rathayibacter rathayi TaxID=33887 RepID=UPI0030B8B239
MRCRRPSASPRLPTRTGSPSGGRSTDAEERRRAVAERILTGCPSSYALAIDGDGPAATGRLAVVTAQDGELWGGLFGLATRPDARRRGLASAVVRALLEEASRRGIERFWLQVLADNAAARRLYAALGCRESSWYEYWRYPPLPSPS